MDELGHPIFFFAMHKGKGGSGFENYRTIAIRSHVAKIISKALLLKNKENLKVGNYQAGCRNTGEHILRLSNFLRTHGGKEEAPQRVAQANALAVFVDFEKAFGSVKHLPLRKTLMRFFPPGEAELIGAF